MTLVARHLYFGLEPLRLRDAANRLLARLPDSRPRASAVPADALGVGGDVGATIAVGQRADLVLWSGDPLDVASIARQVWLDGRATPMRSRQTELRDRYLRQEPAVEAGGLPRAYPAGVR